MARVKISEFRAKNLLAEALGYTYSGLEIDANQPIETQIKKIKSGTFAIKVDQATKKRNQLGLVKLNRQKSDISGDIKALSAQGFRYFLVDPMVEHDKKDERFLALQRGEDGIDVLYSKQGGVDIEANPQSIKKFAVKDGPQTLKIDGIKNTELAKIVELFNKTNMVYLEINPLLIKDGQLLPLDAAVEVDSAAELAVQGAWTEADVRSASINKTPSEEAVEDLQSTSAASLTLRVMNPNGKILLLLSGGGASLVIADEFDSHGLTDELINYGEYSGNPNEDELYEYTLSAIKLLKDSKSAKKVIVIAGGVANFTNIAATFKGIIRAFAKEKKFLKDNRVSVYVRRGGPNQQKGLKLMAEFLDELGLKHRVHGPDVSLSELVEEVAVEVKK